jgi:thioredoxin 1
MTRIIILFALMLSTTLGACQSNGGNGAVSTVSVSDFQGKLTASAKGAQLVDVRTPEEYADGHLKGSVNININSGDFEQQLGKLNKDVPVFVYCRSGGRSARAASKMESMGFKKVYNMDGGITAWGSAGKPVEQ